MPIYTFECQSCQRKIDERRDVEDRRVPIPCECGDVLERIPESFGVDTFEAYYDEGLGCDINSRSERKAVMATLGVVEAGDHVGGARNHDTKAPHQMEKQPLKGQKFKPFVPSAPTINTHDDNGRVVNSKKMSELPEYKGNDKLE